MICLLANIWSLNSSLSQLYFVVVSHQVYYELKIRSSPMLFEDYSVYWPSNEIQPAEPVKAIFFRP
jgi:hypothetical protein